MALCKVSEDLSSKKYQLTTGVTNSDGERLVEGQAAVLIDETPGVEQVTVEAIATERQLWSHQLPESKTARHSESVRSPVPLTTKVWALLDVSVLTTQTQSDERLTFPYKNILVPTDGSPASNATAKHGLALVKALDATGRVLSVVDDTSLGPDVRSVLSADDLERPAIGYDNTREIRSPEHKLIAEYRAYIQHGLFPKVRVESADRSADDPLIADIFLLWEPV